MSLSGTAAAAAAPSSATSPSSTAAAAPSSAVGSVTSASVAGATATQGVTQAQSSTAATTGAAAAAAASAAAAAAAAAATSVAVNVAAAVRRVRGGGDDDDGSSPRRSNSWQKSDTKTYPSGFFNELRGAVRGTRPALGVFAVLWRYMTLNVLAESLDVHDGEEGDIAALTGIYNLVALVSGLLLGMGMIAFLGIGQTIASYGDTPLTRFTIVSIIGVMGCSFTNLLVLLGLMLYITSVDRTHRHNELRHFPMFGVPYVLLIATCVFALLWLIGTMFLSMPTGYGWYSLVFVAMSVGVVGPIAAYAFCFRLVIYNHGNRHTSQPREPLRKLRDISVEEFELILATMHRHAAAAAHKHVVATHKHNGSALTGLGGPTPPLPPPPPME